ncbi:hypothetical protein DdX_15866 [Ditylenchus destructor]|uniref:Uncharacterized protein n=1 Tax=Ditylenchus destructor TaxID=166010 RepID=A0AAD4QXC1_9BILA|nr:hypothetical protein DdX_15866 [Ditylenchus destructor]
MWISSSSSKNRSDRGRIDVFLHGLNWILKASLLILTLASFSVASASELPKDCYNLDTCFAKNSNELRDGPRDDIGFENNDEISWNVSGMSKIELYKNKEKECKKLSFSMDTIKFAESDKDHTNCKFSMLYNGCRMDIEWTKAEMDGKWKLLEFKYVKDGGIARVFPHSSVKVELEGSKLTCEPKVSNKEGAFCDFKSQEDGGWCKFDLAFQKNNCDGTIRFDEDYKLLAKVQTTTAPDTSPTTEVEASSLAPWIITLIVVIPLLLVGVGVGLLVYFLIWRGKRRGSDSQSGGPKMLTGARTFYVPVARKPKAPY